MSNHRKQLITFVIGLIFLAGCGQPVAPTGTVSGRVTLDGQPVRVGVVSLVSDEVGAGSLADLNDQGAYQVKEPLPVGEYQVTVMPRRAPDMGDPEPWEPGYTPPTPPPDEYQPVYSNKGVTISIEPGANVRDIEF